MGKKQMLNLLIANMTLHLLIYTDRAGSTEFSPWHIQSTECVHTFAMMILMQISL